MMKWTVLSDNRSSDSRLSTEHGLSILLTTEQHKILLDTGASDVFARNAEQLGIDLSDVDYVFISHGHSDHAGGLQHLLGQNQQAKIIVSPDAMSGKFFSKRGNLHSITTEWPEIDDDRLILINQTCEVADGLHVIAHIPQIHPMPKGNHNLYVQDGHGDFIHDDFRHEQALYVDGLLFTGCAHSGLENILAACPWPVHAVVGGFHLLDGQEAEEELAAMAQRLKENYPETLFFTSHCTGDHVFEVMKGVMGERLQSFRCGTTIEINDMKDMDEQLMNGLATEAKQSPKPTKDIYLAGGCFWGTEHYFKQIEGVALTEVGFANGHTENPTYKEVYTDTTGYAETVLVRYCPDVVSLEFLLQMFFKAIDPTSLNKQGHDEGTRYRTGVYYTDPADLSVIDKVFAEEQKNYEQPLAVEKSPLQNFYTAEEYHQDYLDKNPDGYCHLPLSLFEFARKAKASMP